LVSEKEEQIRGVLNGGDKNKLHSPSALTIYISLILTFLSPFSPIPTIQFLNYPNAQSWVTKARHPTLQPGTLCKKRIKRPSPRREILIYKNYAPSLRNHELPFPFPFQNHAMPISISLSLSSVHHYYPARGISILDSPNSLSDEIYAPNRRSILPIKQILKICAGRTFSSAIPLAQIQRTGTLHAPSFSTIGWTIRRRGSWVSVCLRKVGHIDGWLLMPEGNV
jgi:hypothetical protein